MESRIPRVTWEERCVQGADNPNGSVILEGVYEICTLHWIWMVGARAIANPMGVCMDGSQYDSFIINTVAVRKPPLMRPRDPMYCDFGS